MLYNNNMKFYLFKEEISENVLLFCKNLKRKEERRMNAKKFHGGVHPDGAKSLTEGCKIKSAEPSHTLVFPMSQHVGKPAKPIVSSGEHVLMGQRIGEADGFISAHVISSVSGTVKAVEPRMTVSGSEELCVVVENDFKDEAAAGFGEKRSIDSLSPSEIREAVKNAGIVGMGGAGFPTHVKITPNDDSAIKYVVLNGTECEPYITSDHRLMLEQGEKVIGGLKILLKLFPDAVGLIGIEDNKRDAIESMTELCKKEEKITVHSLKTKYPQGGERFLLYALTGKKIYSKMLPSDIGCVIVNTGTAAAIYDAVCESKPLIETVVTMSGDAIAEPCNLRAKIGASYADLIEQAGGFKESPAKLISGGPMMGVALFTQEVPVTKTASALLAFSYDEAAEYEPSSCIRCGRCVKVCPGRVLPLKLNKLSIKHNTDGFVALNGMECCECGCCTYVCPAKLNLTQAFMQMKKSVNDNKK